MFSKLGATLTDESKVSLRQDNKDPDEQFPP